MYNLDIVYLNRWEYKWRVCVCLNNDSISISSIYGVLKQHAKKSMLIKPIVCIYHVGLCVQILFPNAPKTRHILSTSTMENNSVDDNEEFYRQADSWKAYWDFLSDLFCSPQNRFD